MTMKKLIYQLSIAILFLSGLSKSANAQTVPAFKQNNPWKDSQLILPETLADQLNSGKKVKIYNIGVVQDIKGAINVGAASDKENLENLKKAVKDLPKDEVIVFYCGCCPIGRCPNIRPAFELLTAQKFTKIRLLNLPDNIKIDWIDKGYPLKEVQK